MAETWSGVLARLGTPTGDGRTLAPGSITSRELPLPLMWQRQTSDGHGGAVVVGRIESIDYQPDMVTGRGTLLEGVEAIEARTLIEQGVVGPSVDLDDLDYVMAEDESIIVTQGRIAGATLVPIPAFADVSIQMTEEPEDGLEVTEDVPSAGEPALVASAAPLPPLSWFTNPGLEGPTPLTVTDDGRVYGHVATWGVCHVGLPGCVTAPQSNTDYAYFMVGAERTAEGVDVPVGKLTVGGGHAHPEAGYQAAAAHYDDAGTAVASVFAGEDAHGIWVAGRVVPGATDEQVDALRRSPLSGDWRRIGGNLELVAAHAVNVPGFPVPRARVKFSGDRQMTLVASLHVEEQHEVAQEETEQPTRSTALAAKARWAWSRKGREA
jgi:hypothetical protein